MPTLLDRARDVLLLGGYGPTETRDIPHGHQLRCLGGEIVCVYSTGKVVAQGKNPGAVKALFDTNPLPKRAPVGKPKAASTVGKPAIETIGQEEPLPRYPTGWSDDQWDGLTPPF